MSTAKRLLWGLFASVCGAFLFPQGVNAQQIYFVDGYHGGVYGHYPLKTYTDYMSSLLDQYPEWRICLEIEPETWDSVKVVTPLALEEFRKQTETERVEFTNPAYGQPYMYNISGESIIRQLGYGMRKIWEHFPSVRFSTYAVEEPCFTSCLPQILTQYGFKYASLKCPDTCWGGYAAAYGRDLVNWIGPDGTSILTSPRYECEDLQKGSVWQTTAWGNTDEYVQACRDAGLVTPVGMCYQDAGWTFGPWIGYGENVRNASKYVTWKEYFEKISAGETSDNYYFSQEDVRPGLVWGAQILQTLAQQCHKTESNIVQTEKMGSIASLTNGFLYDQADIDEAWRTLLLSQHHDCWIVPYNRLNENGNWADNVALWTAASDNICSEIQKEAAESFGSAKAKSQEGSVLVVNTLGFGRKEVVTVNLPEGVSYTSVKNADGQTVDSQIEICPEGNRLSFVADVPAFGYAVYSIKQSSKPNSSCKLFQEGPEVFESGEVTVENDMYKIVFDADRGGTIKSLVDKRSGKEYAQAQGQYNINELRGYFREDGGFRSSAQGAARVEVLKTKLYDEVTVYGRIAGTAFTQTLVLKANDPKIDCRLNILWEENALIGRYGQRDGYNNPHRSFYEDDYKLNVLFPVELPDAELYKDAPFDVCKSGLEDTHFETWDEIKHNVILNWVDLAGGSSSSSFAIFSDHTTSYSSNPAYTLGLTVQFSGNGLWGRDYSITHPTEIHYAFLPHESLWDEGGVYEENQKWNEELLVYSLERPAKAKTASYIDLGNAGLSLSAAYMTEDGLVMRLFNASGSEAPMEVSLGICPSRIERINLKGDVQGEERFSVNGSKSSFSVSVPRFGVRTFLIK